MLDLKLVSGTLVDGTGSAPRRADRGVRSHGQYVDDLVRCADGRWRISVKQGITRMTKLTPS